MQKTAYITGASHGIGKGIATVLAEKGYDIAFTYANNREGAEDTVRRIEALGRKAFYYEARLEQADMPEEMARKAISDLRHIDILVCNAGQTKRYWIVETTAEKMDYLYSLNFRAYYLTTAAVARHMLRENIRGSIVFITSSRGERAYSDDSLYGGIKAALNRGCQSIALELAPFGIRVNCIAPGNTTTVDEGQPIPHREFHDEIPLGRPGTPREVGEAVSYLSSDAAAYITGITLRMDGGLILPGMPESPEQKALYTGIGRLKEMPEAMRKAVYDDEF